MDPILVDLYAGDFNGKPPIAKCAAWTACCGVVLKATEGLFYDPAGWFDPAWKAVRTARRRTRTLPGIPAVPGTMPSTEIVDDEYGVTWFRGAYLFLKFAQMGALQADKYLAAVHRAGGWGPGDLPPIIDVELGNPGHPDGHGGVAGRNPNQNATRAQIIDCVSSCAERLKDETGRPIICYGIGAMREQHPKITSRMSCDYLWPANYNASLPRHTYEEIGWDAASLFAWQYCGDPDGGKLEGYPTTIPGTREHADLSAVQVKDLPALCAQRVAPAPPAA
jgi:hypothetical protein